MLSANNPEIILVVWIGCSIYYLHYYSVLKIPKYLQHSEALEEKEVLISVFSQGAIILLPKMKQLLVIELACKLLS